MVYPIFCLLKGQQNGLWLWWMMNEVKGGKGEPVRVVAVPMPMTRYDMLHAQRALAALAAVTLWPGLFHHIPSHCFLVSLDISTRGPLTHAVILSLSKV